MIPEVKKITAKDGTQIHIELIESGSPIWIIVNHGLGEHLRRHAYFYKLFSQYFNICLYDLRGHGNSGGKRAYIETFETYLDDLEEVKSFLQTSYSLKRYILFGHSMGALIVASYMQNRCPKDSYPEKVFISNPPVAPVGALGKLIDTIPLTGMKALSALPASIPLGGLLDLSKLSHDQSVKENYLKDPLNSLRIHTKLFFELLSHSREVFSRPLRVSCDFYCAIGTEDGIVNPNASIKYFSNFEKNAKVFELEGAYHELHNEIDRFKEKYIHFLKQSMMDTIYQN